jgi:predicted ferric reductase
MKAARSQAFWFVGSAVIFMIFWLMSILDTEVCLCWPQKKWATAFGVAGYYLFALSLLLSSRWKILERALGGLDQIYQLHRKLGIWGGLLILVHPWTEALKWIPERMDKFLFFTLPVHGRVSVNVGSYSYWLMIIILGITLAKLLPYDKWKVMHKFMSLVFILATFHILLSHKRVGSELTHALLFVPMGIGIWSILYKQIFLSYLSKKPVLQVAGVDYVNETVVQNTLIPAGALVAYQPGQYGFFSLQERFSLGRVPSIHLGRNRR